MMKIRQSSLPFHYQRSSSSKPQWDTRTEIQPTNSNQPTFTYCFFDIRLKIILPSIPWFSKLSSSFKYYTSFIYRLFHAGHMVWPQHDPHFDPRSTRNEEHWKFFFTLEQRFSNFFQVGTTFIIQNVLRTTLLLGLSNSLGCPKQCSKHVFATENPSFVVESRVGRVVNFIKCQSWERKFKDASCM